MIKVINCNLRDLLSPWVLYSPEFLLKGIAVDSRDVLKDFLFIAIPGYSTDGRLYILDAIHRGAIAVVSEALFDKIKLNNYKVFINNVPILYMKGVNKCLSTISGKFYNHPSKYLKLIGVTGTNGKTSISFLLACWVQLLNEVSAVMGTIGNGKLNSITFSKNTTCSAIDIQRMLFDFYNQGVTFVAMEVSSHGLSQYRVMDLHFSAAVFTNLTHDHLDYHSSMVQYEQAKWQLFSNCKVNNYIINCDDKVGYNWAIKLPNSIAVTMNSHLPNFWKGKWLRAISVHYYPSGTSIEFSSSWGSGIINTKLIGLFNVSNILLSLATLLSLHYPLHLLLETAPMLQSVRGRMEVINAIGYPTVIIDYAHNPCALKKALLSIKYFCSGKLICVFGCGGDRDKLKRPIMGAIAECYSDFVIITNDNVRNEASQDIINDIIGGVSKIDKVTVIFDRSAAIAQAINMASSEDFVLIAGKGHEHYESVKEEFIMCNGDTDQEVVRHILGIY